MTKSPALTDPKGSARALGPLTGLALKWVGDERDLRFIRLMAGSGVFFACGAALLYWPGQFRWWLGAVYLAANLIVVAPPCILMSHNVIHRPLFRPEVRWMDKLLPYVWGPFFGHTPESYAAHHVGMHHVEGNLPSDASSTMRFQRDSLRDFGKYVGRFLVIGLWDVSRYFWKARRSRVLWKFLAGELVYYAAIAALFFVNWRATLVVFLAPYVIVRAAMMAGNWGQHAFIDPADPGNSYRNSITCINSIYNQRCFNDGYHIGHHVKMSRHWTEMPEDFERNVETYAKEGAIVFRGVDFFLVWALLMAKRYDVLARRYVDLTGTAPGEAEVIALLKSRTRRIESEALAAAA